LSFNIVFKIGMGMVYALFLIAAGRLGVPRAVKALCSTFLRKEGVVRVVMVEEVVEAGVVVVVRVSF
jgi:hypothetical protein